MERFSLLDSLWVSWQQWFAEVEETHTSLGVLSFFRSPSSRRSWITAAGAILDAASLRLSALELPFNPEAGLCVRGGFVALRAIADYYDIPFDPDATYEDPISISKDEFLDACDQLVAAGLPVREDREDAWKQFRGWRVNYDSVLVGLAGFLDGAVRAVVVGPLPRVPATAPAPQAPRAGSDPAQGTTRSEQPGLGRGRRLVETDVPLGAEHGAEEVVRQGEEERVGADL